MTSLEECSNEPAVEAVLAAKGRIRPLPWWVDQWREFVGTVEVGYTLTVYDYENDIDTRKILDEVYDASSSMCRAALEEALEPLDQRYLSATVDAPERDPNRRPGDSWYRHPRILAGELWDDLSPFR